MHATGFTDDERDEADAARARLQNLVRDAVLVNRLREQGFQGPEYSVFTAVLASYGLPVMWAWIRRGEIFRLVAGRGRPVNAPYDVREHLACGAGDDDRLGLATETTATALHRFHEDALLNGRLSLEGGTTLNTFFAGSCILAFANVFRRWLADDYAPRRELCRSDLVLDHREVDTDPGIDPAAIAVRNNVLASALDLAMDPRVRQAVGVLALTASEYAQIAQQVGMTEDGLKRAMLRFRRKAHAAREELFGA